MPCKFIASKSSLKKEFMPCKYAALAKSIKINYQKDIKRN